MSRYQVASSTPLQLLIHFNAFASLLWALFHLLISQWKAQVWPPPIWISVLDPMCFYLWCLIELARLTLGHIGNLSERIASLSGFWFLIVFPQLPLQLYFALGQDALGWVALELEVLFSLILIVFYVAEMLIGYGTNKRIVAKTAADFHLQYTGVAADYTL